ncbi:MAG: glycosyltransferase [Solirubrobacteraceae bacterium]
MKVRSIEPADSIGAQRGEIVVCIPVYGGHDLMVRCLRSVLSHTPSGVRIIVCDDASPDERSRLFVRGLDDDSGDRELFYLRREHNVGFPANVNGAFASAAPADVVVLNSDCVVAHAWLEGLRDAAYQSGRVATATPLTNHGTLASVPDRGQPRRELPGAWELETAATAIRAHSRRIRPRLPTAIGHCMFVRRTALDLVGDFDLAFSPGYGEEVDFSQRCILNGLCHVLADDVLVFHHGGGSFAPAGGRAAIQDQHEQLIAARYPHYHPGLGALEATPGPLDRAIKVARTALTGLSVTIDARVADRLADGTQARALELSAALSATGQTRVTLLVSDDFADHAAAALGRVGGVDIHTTAHTSAAQRPADVVHRLTAVRSDEELDSLRRLGERLIITGGDLTSYHNPSYFPDFASWERHRRLTREALASADRVGFGSSCARDDALAEGLVEASRASVVRAGVDHPLAGPFEPAPPLGASGLANEFDAILCLGPDLRHGNRVFALRVLEQLQRRHNWAGGLVLAGPHAEHGSSEPEERELLARSPSVADATVHVDAVGEAQRAWLLARSRLVLLPSVDAGSGLTAFDAAARGVPCMWPPGTALSELVSDEYATIVPWDAEQTAERASHLLLESEPRERTLAAISAAAQPLTWCACAERLRALYEDAYCASTFVGSRTAPRDRWADEPLSEDARRLVGPGGALPDQAARPLLALASHRKLGAPVLRALELGYRASRRLQRWRGRNGSRAGSGA